jgi:DNA-directed RNA polymerase specialized sigma24 family protein
MNRFDVDSPEQQAERTVNEHYRELQAEVTGTVRHKLTARKMRLDESDLEEAYCQAWHGVCETIKRGTQVSNLTGMLIEITWRRAVDIYRELRPSQRGELDIETPTLDLDLDAQLDDRIKLKRFIAQVRGRLNPRECEAVSLCVIHGYPRAEAAELMGLQRRQMEKLMDRATAKVGGIIASIAARGCGGDEWARLMQSYALGLIAEDDRDYPRAAEHVAHCASCSRYVNGLRGLTAIIPPVLPFGPLANAGHSAGILALLKHLFRGGGHSGGRMAGAGAASGGGGGGLAGSLSSGTIAKGVAVVATGAAALALTAHDHKAPYAHARQPAPTTTQTQVPPTAVASATTPAPLHSSAATSIGADTAHRHTHHPRRTQRTYVLSADRHATQGSQSGPSEPAQAVLKVGGENASSAPAPPTPSPPAEPSRTSPPDKESASAAAVNKEFGWER